MRRRSHILLVATATVATLAALGAAPAGAATRYAKASLITKGTGTAPCTDSAKPCTLLTALGQAVAGDEVELAPGNYYATRFALIGGTLAFTDPVVVKEGVTMRGRSSTDLPVIHVAPDAQADAGVALEKGATVRDIAIEASAKANTPISYSLGLGLNSVADRVRVRTTAAPGAIQIACSVPSGSTLRNALCLGVGTGGRVDAASATSPDGSTSFRNVTAITTVESGRGLNFGTSSGTATTTISNSIFRGPVADLSVRAGVTGGNATARVDHTNWVTQSVSAVSGASAQLIQQGGNQNGATTSTPLFVDPAIGDYRQAAGSPTINAGVVDAGNNGTFALGGAKRWIGATTDIGADEFDPDVVLVPTPLTTATDPATGEPGDDRAVSDGPGSAPGSASDKTAPTLTRLSVAKRVSRKRGTTIRFTLSEPATVRLAFGQPKTGRSVGGRCKALTKANRTQPRCTIKNVRGTLMVAGVAGRNALAFKGKLSARRQLALGGYTLTAAPTDAAGNRGEVAKRMVVLTR